MLVISLIFSFFLFGCSSNKQQEESSEALTKEYNLKMSITVSESSTWFKAAEQFANEVKDKTNGRIKISIYPNEQLSGGDSGKAIELLIKGSTDLTYNSTIIYSILDERFGVVSAPFLFKDLESVDKALAGEGGEAINSILREKGVEPLGFGQNGFRQATNNEHPIKSPDDIKGLKMRIPGIKMYVDLWKILGADPIKMTFSEVFTSLQQGTIDGQENPIDVIHSSKLNEVQKYITMWNYSYDPVILGMNKKLYDSLHPEDQKVIKEAAANANAYQIDLARQQETKQIEFLKENGLEFYYPTDKELEAFKETVQPIYEQYGSKWGKEFLEEFQK